MHCINEVFHKCKGQMLKSIQHQKWSTDKGILSERIWKHMPHSTFCWLSEFCKSQCLSHFTMSFINTWTKASIAENQIKYSTLYLQTHSIFNAWQPQPCWTAFHKAKLALHIAHTSCFIHPCVCDILGFTRCIWHMQMILPQVHLRKPCYDFSFL